MRRWPGAASAALAALALSGGQAGPQEETAQARELVQRAAELAQGGQPAEALPLLEQALAEAPTYPPVHSWLSHVYELQGDKCAALEHLARFAALQPDAEYTTDAADRLFYTGAFPRELPEQALAISPVRSVVDSVRTSGPDGTVTECKIAYTISLRYPEGTEEGSPILRRPLPGQAPPDADDGTRAATGEPAAFNRSLFGYIEDPATGRLRLRCITYYPSDLLTAEGTDYAATAVKLTHLFLRFRYYAEAYLALVPTDDPEGLVRLWLCEQRAAGAERLGADVFFYGIGQERQPIEWVRELAHEYGHAVIPRVAGFVQPEPTANGELGERLLIDWLCQEAGLAAGESWPAAEAGAALDGLWGAPLDAARYLAEKGRSAFAFWYEQGPSSELVVGQDEAAMTYFNGLALYIRAAYSDETLGEVMRASAGVTVADFLFAFKQTMGLRTEAGQIALCAGAFDPVASQLSADYAAGQIAPSSVTISSGDAATYQVYLTRCHCAVRLEGEGPDVALSVAVDNLHTATASLGAAEPEALGTIETGWHRISVRSPADLSEAVRLRRIVLITAPPV